jgi:glutathione S-transferase
MSEPSVAPYELYYWPMLQGRGEFARLALEEADVPYVDVARLPESEGGGVQALLSLLREGPAAPLPFAPPILKVGELVLAQTANILLYLGRHHGLAPGDEAGQLAAHQLQLTVTDLVAEVHDTHHPLGSALYYEDQKAAAKQRAKGFIEQRLPRFLGYFERTLERNPLGRGRHLVGAELSYVDLSLFQVLEGLAYALPRAFERARAGAPRLLELRERVAGRPRIAAYLASGRRIPFNETGIFRHYPELDAAES